MTPNERLALIAEQLQQGETPAPVTVRTFLSWFDAQRRGFWITKMVRKHLQVAGLVTDPDFEGAYLDSEIGFHLRGEPSGQEGGTPRLTIEVTADLEPTSESGEITATASLIGGGVQDPTHRIGKLAAANQRPTVVGPETPLREAVTLMLMHDFSQLPVMQGDRTVKGVISWQSIGSRMALSCPGDQAKHYMTNAVELSADVSLFSAIRVIVEHQYVLIRGSDQKITGIITTSDLSLQFQQLAEPFLLLGEIENHIRRLIDGKFTSQEMEEIAEATDAGWEVNTVADLTFGQYVHLLGNPEKWSKLHLEIDRSSFVKQLDRVREIRNNVMHFDPDGVAEDELELLRKFVQFLQALRAIGAT